MDSPFSISPKQVANMTAEEQTELFNLVIRDEARRLGMGVDQVLTTDKIDVADEAIDAITESAPSGDEHIPKGGAVWQYKKSRPDWKKLKKDLADSAGAKELFARGAGYVYIEGSEMTAIAAWRRTRKLEALLPEVGCSGQVRFLNAKRIAEWAGKVPAAVFILQEGTRGYFRPDRLLSSVPHGGIPYEADELREVTIEEIRARLFGEDSSTFAIRVIGPAGVGKTRMVLELLSQEGVADLALYAPSPPTNELLAWVESNKEISATIVIDECDELEAERYEQLAALSGGRVRLITIGVGRDLGGSRTFSLNPLDDDAMERVVRSVATSLSHEQVSWVVEQTRGYVKLARAVAIGVAKGAVDFQSLHSDEDVRRTIQRLVLPEDLPRRALTAVALLTKLGWLDDVAEEGRIVAAFVGLSWENMREGVRVALTEGLVSTRGRYWYVSPEFLAVTLAAQFWTTDADRIEDLHSQLPGPAKDALLERLTSLDVPGIRDALARLLGGDGPFRELDSLDDAQAASLFRTLAMVAPAAALDRLDVLLGTADTDRLREFKQGRRDIVWALQFLASRAQHFERASRHLLALGAAENEAYANNASGCWEELFLTFLGATEAAAASRLSILSEAVTAGTPAERLLAIRGLGAALEGMEAGSPMMPGAGPPPSRWRPVLWQDAWDYKRGAIDLLLSALTDENEEVRQSAATAALTHTRQVANSGLPDQAVRILREVLTTETAPRRRIWEEARATASKDRPGLDDEVQQALEEIATSIYGGDLEDRILRYAGKWSWVDWPTDEGGARPEDIAVSLGDEAFERPEVLESLLPWLVSPEAEGAWPFGRRLGQLDETRSLFASFAEATRSNENATALVLSAYLSGRVDAGDEMWVHDTVDSWASDADGAQLATEVSVRLGGSEQSLNRLFRLIDDGRADPTCLTWTRFGRWMDSVSTSSRAEAARRLLAIGPAGREAGLALVEDLVKSEPSPTQEVIALAYDAIGVPEEGSAQLSPMVSFHWKEIAHHLVPLDPARIANLVLTLYRTGNPPFHDERLELLASATDADPAVVWPVIGEFLLSSQAPRRLLWEMESLGTLQAVPVEVLRAWLRQAGQIGAAILATATKPVSGENDDLLALLLSENPETNAQLANNYWSGGYTGAEARRLEELVERATPWLSSPHQVLREWSAEMIQGFERRLPAARLEDEESLG